MKSMTITEKILAAHADKDYVVPGDLIECRIDIALGNDITAPIAIKEFHAAGFGEVFDNEKVVLVPDHFTPNKDIKSAEQAKILRDFANEQDLTNYFEIGEMGIEHVLLPEKGIVTTGDVIIGADSHTCTYGALSAFSTGVGSTDLCGAMASGKVWFKVPETIKFVLTGKINKWVSGKDLILYIIGKIGVDGALYKSMEYTGSGISNLDMADRFTISNMAIEAGAKNGIFPFDTKTKEYVESHSIKKYTIYKSDPDANYCDTIEIKLEEIEPVVSFPHLPENTKNVSEINEKIILDQVVIGSCTNGRLKDLQIAADILKGKKIAKGLRVIILPGTQNIVLKAMELGYIETFIKAGAVVSTPTCGPCLGGHMGILAKGERALATTNRNFIGRMGSPESEVYLSSPAVAAASAITGYICGPENL